MGKLLDVYYKPRAGQEKAEAPTLGIELIAIPPHEEFEVDYRGETGELFIRKVRVPTTLYCVARAVVRDATQTAEEALKLAEAAESAAAK